MGTSDKRMVESVLFSATNPVSISEIKQATGLSRSNIKNTIETLIDDYNIKRKNETSIKVVKAGDKYIMQVSKKFTKNTESVANPEIDPNLLKTLTLIAFHQPIKQSNLRRMIGTKAYEHVDELASMRLINARRYRSTEMLTTTKKFPEYFGIGSTKPEDIKDFLMKKAADKIKKS